MKIFYKGVIPIMIKMIDVNELKNYEMNEHYRVGRRPGFSSQDVMQFLHSQDLACEVVIPKGTPVDNMKTAYQNSIKRYGNNQIHLKNIGDRIFMVKDGQKVKNKKNKKMAPPVMMEGQI